MYIYVDETGNTGLDLFKNDQPFYILGGLISEINLDMDVKLRLIIKEMAEHANLNELHGNANESAFDFIAPKLEILISELNLRFLFSCVEKEHLAGVKFLDYLLDSDTNKAVSPLSYRSRALRLIIVQQCLQCFPKGLREAFWEAYKTQDNEALISILSKFQEIALKNLIDQRLKEILCDAIEWATKHISDVFDFKRSKMDSPNYVALSTLINQMNVLVDEEDQVIDKFIHDEQREFKTIFETLYSTMKQVKFEVSDIMLPLKMKELNVLQPKFQMGLSKESVGLQLIDVFTWVFKRHIFNPFSNKKMNSLGEVICCKSNIHAVTSAMLLKETKMHMDFINNLDINDDGIEKGKAILKELENRRKEELRKLRTAE
ncbi:DUF3800 domain-containing protein [Leptospira sp. 201903071]|uniref:DUF3800 domain-containing protein n=1 Tax=Leptospira ainazelensis TaxID=2810034 RepID=UPI0019668D9C|nr:DUF3800 domain-containing protein [Leptospira ainazelensis]MBM9500282.1 DUF3800 domain-containing protein [Leptospira ainazelensis]